MKTMLKCLFDDFRPISFSINQLIYIDKRYYTIIIYRVIVAEKEDNLDERYVYYIY